MMSFGFARLVPSTDSLAISDGTGGNSAATWTSFGFAVVLADLSAPRSALPGGVLLFSISDWALAILTDVAGFAGPGVAVDATVAAAAGAPSSSSSSRARPKSLANGLTGARWLLARTVSTLTPALRAASSESSDGASPRFLISASATA